MPIEVKNLTHIYGEGTPFERKALDDICLSINDGEFIGIIGHTGSGKSTLISYFNGLSIPENGTVLVNGTDISAKDTSLINIRRTVGLVFQYPEYQLFEETVEKDISFGPRNLKLSDEEIGERVCRSMEMVGLDASLAAKSPFELSGGQKRRVAIAGVLAMKPSILVLDEPAAGLDPVGRRDMLDLVKKIHDSGVTIIMVSHSMDDVGRLCDRLFVLDHGKIAFTGTPAEVFVNAEALQSIGLDVPEYAKLANSLRSAGWHIPEGIYRIEDVKKAILEQIG